VVRLRRLLASPDLPSRLRAWLANPDEVALAYHVLRRRPGARLMIDVGAHFGGSLKRFARDGWRVHAFEPDPINREKLEDACGELEGVSIDPRAVSNQVEMEVCLYRSDVSSGISGLSSFHPSHEAAGTVSSTTLERFCEERGIDGIDFLKVDTEGYDLFVLQGIAWERIRPRFIVCEFEDRKTLPLGYSFHDLARYLVERGYRVTVSEWHPIVEYGGSHRWRRFRRYPCELEDRDGWGNLMAVADTREAAALAFHCRRVGARARIARSLLPTGAG